MNQVTTAVLAAALVCLLPAWGLGQRADRRIDLEALDLSAQQTRELRDIARKAAETTTRLEAELDEAAIQLEQVLAESEPDEARVAALVDRITELEGERRKTRILSWLRIRKRLDADQRARVLGGLPSLRRRPALPDEVIAEKPEPAVETCDEVTCLVEPDRACCKTATLSIATSVPARIVIDGKVMGISPIQVRLHHGYHNVRAEPVEGGDTVLMRRVKLSPGESTRLSLDFEGR